MDSKRYKKIVKLPREFALEDVNTFIPKPDASDYERGYLTRFFIQRVNDRNGVVYEVNSKNFTKYSINTFYLAVALNWKIIGSDENEVKLTNSKSVRYASKNLPAVSLYLPNLLQFYKK
jgi:hypothetical protein